jgi:hypothetical protein
MLVYTKSRIAVPSFLFTVGTVTRVIIALLALLRLTGFLIGLYKGLEHNLHEGHAIIAPKFLVGLLGLSGPTCCCLKRLTIAVIATAVQDVVGLVGTGVCSAMLANLSLRPSLGTRPVGLPYTFCLGLLLASGRALAALPFALSFSCCFSTMTCLIAYRSGSNARVDSETVV